MNLKKIISEELSALSDSFYLLVSDDEKFIYGAGRLGGKSFQPIENFDAEAILRSRFRTEGAALDQLSWAEYYKGGGGTPGEIADRMLKHNPKVVPVDFILRKRDESFPIIESNELDWIKNVDPMRGGEYFNDSKEICFGDNQRYCDVRINNEYITFYFSEDDFRELWDDFGYSFDDEWWVIQPIIQNGTPYDGDNDYYELDLDEFNYSYYSFSDNHIDRFNEILRTVGSGDSVDNFQDEMNSLMNVLKYPKIQYMFDIMANEYVNELGYIVQRNRWLAISDQWDEVTKKAGVGVNMLHGDIVIKIPIEKAYQKYYNDGVNDLTQLFKAIIEVLSDTNWYEWFMDGWDTNGGEDRIDTVLNNFLDKTEDYIESEDFEKWEKVLSDFEYLGIKNRQNSYRYNYHQLERENPNDNTIWIIILKGDYDKVDLNLHKKHSSTYYDNQDALEKHVDVPVEEISKYIKPLD